MYEFADQTVPNWKSLGAPSPVPEGYHVGPGHTAELFYLLDYKAVSGPLNADQLALADTMIDMWVDFARKPDAAQWPAYSADARNVVALQLPAAGGIATIADAYTAHNCDFWNK